MPTNTESLNRELFRLLSKYKPKPLDAEGKATPVPDEADIFKFEFTKDGEDYGTVYVTLDDERVMTVYFGDDVTESPGDKTPGLDYDDTWSGLLHQLSSWRMTKGLRGFKTQNKDRVGDDMARRNHMRNKDKIAEGYYPMGKSRSYSDAVPSVKIVIEHSRTIEEGEQRYRNINRIFLENQDGERYLLDTKKPGIARVYARHIAEGGKVNDDRWNHIGNLCEEYQKMAGFVRATRNGQFNESAQQLVNEGLEHYQSLRESLSRMTGKRGYNAYFESWTPSLMEDGTEENNLNELFVQETLDPRIESVMPILNRIHKKVSESVIDKEMNKLAEWADSLSEAEGESIGPGQPGIPEGEEVDEAITPGASLQRFKNDPRGNQKLPATPANESDDLVDIEPALKGLEDEFDKFLKHGDRMKSDPAYGDKWNKRYSQIAAGEKPDDLEYDPDIDEGLDANQKRVGQLGPTEKVKNNNIGKLVGANENFINTVDQAVTTEEDEMDDMDIDAIPGMDEGTHTQHAMRGRNPGANEFEHDFENDKIDNIHDKISKMLKKLAKPEHEPNMKDTDIGNTLHEEYEDHEGDEEYPMYWDHISNLNKGTWSNLAKHHGKNLPKVINDLEKERDDIIQRGGNHNATSTHDHAIRRLKEYLPSIDSVTEGQEDLDAILRIIRK